MILFEMANIIQEDSGLPMIIYISPKSAGLSPQVRVQKDYSSNISTDLFSITIENRPKVIGDTGEIKKSDIKLVKDWVKINTGLLTDYWTGKEHSTKKVLNELIKLSFMDTKKRKQASRKVYEKRLMNARFEITSVSREDLINKEVGFTKKEAFAVTDNQMRKIASKLADNYVNQLFWSSLKVIAESVTSEE